MTFQTSFRMIQSPGLNERLTVAAADLGRADAPMFIQQNIWGLMPHFKSLPDGNGETQYWWQIWEFHESNMTVNNNPDIGARTDVILDTWITAALDSFLNPKTDE